MQKHQMDKREWLDKGALKWLYQARHPQVIKGEKAMKNSNFCEFQHPNVPAEALRVLWLMPADPGKWTSFPKFGARTV